VPIAAIAGAFVITTCEGKQRDLSCYGALRTEMSRGRVWCVHNSRHASEMGISVAVHQHTSAREGKADRKASHKTVWDQKRRFHVLVAWCCPTIPWAETGR